MVLQELKDHIVLGLLKEITISCPLKDISEGVSEVVEVMVSLVEEDEFRLGFSLSLLYGLSHRVEHLLFKPTLSRMISICFP
jgi:hypothetical protein